MIAPQLLHTAAYGEETPLGSSLVPFARVFEELDISAVLAYRARTYVSSGLVVTASGISALNLKSLLETHLAALPKGDYTPLPSPFVGGEVRVTADLKGATTAGLGFPVHMWCMF